MTLNDQMYEVLKNNFHLTEFRTPQEDIISSILSGNDVLAVLPTGAGKSLCYQLPAIIFPRLTIVISPLIALMKDQVSALVNRNIASAFWNSELHKSSEITLKKNLKSGLIKILYISPEKLLQTKMTDFLVELAPSQIIIDEAHCVEQWGGDFRPEYKRIKEFIAKLSTRPVISAFTATAPAASIKTISDSLGLNNAKLISQPYYRPNLNYGVIRPDSEASKRAIVLKLLNYWKDELWGSAIIYVATRSESELLTHWLKQNGFSEAMAFHAGLEAGEKSRCLTSFSTEPRPLVVCTSAFGMGIDRADVRMVLHHTPPLSMEAYAQESGRAGRDGLESWCLLLYRELDLDRNFQMIVENASFNQRQLQRTRALKIRQYALGRKCCAEFIFNYFRLNGTPFWDKVNCNCLQCKPNPVWKYVENAKTVSKNTFLQLRALRQQRAKELGVPSYFLGNDILLQRLCAQRPQTWQELKKLAGFGHVRLYYWGRDVLRILTDEAKLLTLPVPPK